MLTKLKNPNSRFDHFAGVSQVSVLSFNQDGLELARVKPKRREIAVWHMIALLYIFLFFRLVVAADVGSAGYGARMQALSAGSLPERIAAQIMSLDPISRRAAINLRKFIRGPLGSSGL